ncbi:hypothetical protein [Nostoc sp.]
MTSTQSLAAILALATRARKGNFKSGLNVGSLNSYLQDQNSSN